MDDRKRLEQYLAWRRAQRNDRRRRIYRRLRTGGMVATLTLALAAVAVTLHGWVRPAQHDSLRLPAQVSHVSPPLAVPRPAPEPAVPTPSTGEVNVEEPGTPSAPAPRSRVTGAWRGRQQASLPPRTGRSMVAPAMPPPALAQGRSPGNADTASPSPKGSLLDSRTDAGPSPALGIRPPALAPPAGSDGAEEPRRTTTEVVIMPPPAPTPVVVEPAPASHLAPVTPPAAAAPWAALNGEEETRMDRLKRFAGYIPEVWLARTVARWVKAQPAGELPPPTPARELPQGR